MTPIVHIHERAAEPAEPPAPKQPARPYGMNVRFTADEKAALERLALSEERSQQQVLMRLVGPLLIERARQLG